MSPGNQPPAGAVARIDAAGRLIEAEPRIADLNARAGGALGSALAVPQLATLARLAQRLRILVARGVTVADGDDDLDLWVRAEPVSDGGVRLVVSGWRARAPISDEGEDAARALDLVRTREGWRFETDAALRLTHIGTAAGAAAHALLGAPLTRLFQLGEDDEGAVPLLSALARRSGVSDQPATLRTNGVGVRLSVAPRLDPSARFAGLVGSVAADDAPAVATPPAAPGLPPAFGAQLDRALRTPLGRIIAHADSIYAQAEGPLRRDYAEYAADIASAGRHLLGLVDDLVDLQAIERVDFAVAPEAIDLADVARRAAGLLQVRASERRVRIDKPAADETLPATGDFRRALQVLVNLIGNAVRYSPDGAMVWIRAEQDGGRAVVIVADQGKGIAAADQARIFEKFERVDVLEPGGSGLGLYIARRLARAMGGDISVESAPGQGARFAFWLPVGA